jgi:glutamyl-tRNA reductase
MIGLLGLDYRYTSAELRGRLTFSGERLLSALRTLAGQRGVDEAVIVSTCNRTEVYVASTDWPTAVESVRELLASAYQDGAPASALAHAAEHRAHDATEPAAALAGSRPPVHLPPELATALYELEDTAAAQHLFRVASGLESMVVGEAQILGQVRDALASSEAVHAVGEELRALFTAALKVGKRARSETEVGRADVSVASLAVEVAGDSLGGLEGKSALLIGAGRTSQLCARLLRERGIGRLVLANRTLAAAADLAGEVGGEAIAFAELAEAIASVQLIISATAAPHVVLRAATVARGMVQRRSPLVVIDLAVPPDVEEDVGLLPDVSLYTLDTLHGLQSSTLTQPAGRQTEELARVAEIVQEGVREYVRARTVRMAVPGIAALRRHVDRSEELELARALAQLEHLSPAERAVVERFGRRLVDKMFHHLVSRIRSLAEYDEVPPHITMHVLTRLFADPDAASDAGEFDGDLADQAASGEA